jgi:polysaccharide deacetylase family protein (PEP-CTERM system associated)
MPNTFTVMPTHRSPAALPSQTWLPALVPSSRPEKGQASGCDFEKENPVQTAHTHPRHILTFDLEEHFHASRFDAPMRRRHWSSFESRIHTHIEQILEILGCHSTKATFFTLGWLAEQHPSVICAVSGAGHEIACLGYGHELVAAHTPQSFREDIRRAKSLLEDITGHHVVGFRAPSLSITAHTPWALPIVAEEGFLYDSSVLPIVHDLAGIPGANRWIHLLSWNELSLLEIPPSTLNVGGFCIAIGGGGYLRALNYPTLKSLLSRIETSDKPIVAYIRSWEIDAAQPRMRDTRLSEFRHYVNLGKTADRLHQLLADFQFGPVREVAASISEQIRNASAPTVPDSDIDLHPNGSPQLTTM